MPSTVRSVRGPRRAGAAPRVCCLWAVLCAASCGPAGPAPAAPQAPASAEPAAATAEPTAATVEPAVVGDPSSVDGAGAAPRSEQIPRPGLVASHSRHFSNVVLWCDTPAGPACRLAAAELQLVPTETDGVPDGLLANIQDLSDDCSDSQIATLSHRLTLALGLDPGRWHSHIGASMARGGIRTIYQGGGCVSCCSPQDPSAKIHAVYGSDRKGFLVRVWEAGVN